jgi:hypothetical protein
MKTQGEYKEILGRKVEIISNTRKESNAMSAVYGRFLAAVIKKFFYGLVSTADRSKELSQTILLTFPIEGREEEFL